MFFITLILTTAIILYYFLRKSNQYWEKKRVKGPTPLILVGNMKNSCLFKESPGKIYTDIYEAYKDEDVVGLYRGTTPALLVRNPDLIKDIVIKSFSHFHDNDIYLDKKIDPIFGRNAFVLKGEEWKVVRSLLTPAFTSGKMKSLFPLIKDQAKAMLKFIETTPETGNGKGYEAKELCIRFTLNNVATCAFGIEGKCFDEDDSEFRQLSKEFFSPGSFTAVMFLFLTLFPSLTKYVPIRLVTKKVEEKLLGIVSDALAYRAKHNIRRNDFLQVMNDLKETSKEYIFNDVDVTAQAAGFFGDGSETSSIVMSFTLFEIARNPQCQEKLRQEINKALKEHEELNYEDIQSMSYLEACINETLRIHPAIFALQKVCTENFELQSRNGSVTIEKDTPIILPLLGLQHDSKFFENPSSFIPERFLGDNKEQLNKYAFMPFGEGPRACLGKRFGILQIEIGIAHIIKSFEVTVNEKTKLPITYLQNHPMTTPVGGLWLNFKKNY